MNIPQRHDTTHSLFSTDRGTTTIAVVGTTLVSLLTLAIATFVAVVSPTVELVLALV